MAEITIVPGSIQLVKMTDPEYFALEGYISNSRLGLINPDEDGSPEKYKAGITNTYSESFALGSAIHAKVLQPDYYVISDIHKPSAKLGIFAEELFKFRSQGLSLREAIFLASESSDYYSGKLSGTRLKTAIKGVLPFYLKRMKHIEEPGKETIFMPEAMKYKFTQCMKNIEDPKSNILNVLYPPGLLQPAQFFNEYAILCEADYINSDTGEITRLKLKGKLDNFTLDHENETLTLNDLKTTGKPVSYFMGNFVKTRTIEGEEVEVWYNGSFQYYRYYRQMGMYMWLLQLAIKELYGYNYKLKGNMLVVETIPEFQCKVYPINGKQIKFGLDEFKNLITLVVEWMNLK